MTTVRFGGTTTNFMLYQMAKDKQEQEKLQKQNAQKAQYIAVQQNNRMNYGMYPEPYLPSYSQNQIALDNYEQAK